MSNSKQKNIEDIYPLSPMQQGMLFHSVYKPESGAYFEQFSCILTGTLNREAFVSAWQQVTQRHTTLRTSFVWKKINKMMQVVHKSVELPISFDDWRTIPNNEQEIRFQNLLESERRTGFNLSKAPLMRFHLVQIAEDACYFLWCFHHLLTDGWSMPVILKEVFTIYEAGIRNIPAPLEPAKPYRAYIDWIQKQDQEKAKEFWQELFGDFASPVRLRIENNSGVITDKSNPYKTLKIELEKSLFDRLNTLTRMNRLTVNTVVQGVWAFILSRYGSTSDVVFGATVSGRPPELSGVENMVGLFINTLPLRISVPGNLSITDWLRGIQSRALDMRVFEYSQLVDIQGWSSVPRDIPLFNSIVVYENYPVDPSMKGQKFSLEISGMRSVEQTNYPLTLVAASRETLVLEIAFESNRFSDDSIQTMLQQMEFVFKQITDHPEKKLSDLLLMPAEQMNRITRDWNRTDTPFPDDACIQTIFEGQVKNHPDHIAVQFGKDAFTYKEFNKQVNQLSHFLRAKGVGPEKRVAIYLERSFESMISLMAVIKAGGAYVPMDPTYPADRLRHILEDSEAQLIITDEKLINNLPSSQAMILNLDSTKAAIAIQPETNPEIQTDPVNLAYIIYTSGSTGRPKGTLLQHRGAVNNALALGQHFSLKPGKSILQFASIGFDASVAEIFGALLNGAGLHLIDRGTILSESALPAYIRKQKISTIILPPSVLAFMENENLPDLEVVGSAGEACSREIVQRWIKNREFVNGYGPTETTVSATLHHLNETMEIPHVIPIGQPMQNAKVYVLDEHLNPLPPEIPGELCVDSVGLARGYLHRPDLTAEKFIPNPFSETPGSRIYRTGDLVRFSRDGMLEFLGRIDHQIKIRGFRIEPGEIETVLKNHPSIRDAAVLADEIRSGQPVLTAYIVSKGDRPEISDIQDFLSERLPDYMIPSVFIPMDSFPLTTSGKVNRPALPKPEQSEIEKSRNFIGPRNQTEEILSGIWQSILKADQISITDNFFHLGGHSLLATQLVSRIRDAFEVEIPLRNLFEAPALADMALEIEKSRQTEKQNLLPPIEPADRSKTLPLSFAQQRLWFLDQLAPGGTNYNLPAALRLSGTLNRDALEKSITEIIRRHETLRTTFSSHEGEAIQIIHQPTDVKLMVSDLSVLSAEEKETESRRMILDEAARPFDLAKGPLIRTALIRHSENEHIILFTMHHIISDGWSMGVLVNEISRLYETIIKKQPSNLPGLKIQYADYAVWQNKTMRGKVLETQLTYWKDHLGINPPALELPTDYPRPAVQTFNGRTVEKVLPKIVSEQVRDFSRGEGVTLFMTLLAAFQTLMHRYSGQDDILIGSPVANRTSSETEKLIGFFVNTLIFKAGFEENPTVKALLRQVRETTLQAYAHQDIPFEKLVEHLQPERNMSHSPLFQAAFILQNAPIEKIQLPGLTINPVEGENRTSKYDLTLNCAETPEGLGLYLEYNTDLFKPESARRILDHYHRLLECIMENPKLPISEYDYLSAAERKKILSDWNQTKAELPNSTIPEVFADWVRRQPDAPAVQYHDTILCYAPLNRKANQLAGYIRTFGVQTDDIIGICLERSDEVAVAILAILKAGCAFLPIDPTYPPDRISYMIEDSGIKIIITHEILLGQLTNRSENVICLDRDAVAIQKHSGDDLSLSISPDNLAYVIYTSGSTGRPKGTMLPHIGSVNLARAQKKAFSIVPDSRILQFAPLSFDASVWETVMTLLNGATLVYEDQINLTTGQGLLKSLKENKITTVTLPPSVLAVVPDDDLPELKTIITAGEKCTVDLVARWGQSRQFVNAYGPTETTVCASMYETQAGEPEAPPIGKPISNFRLYVLDKRLQPVPVGVPGELCIGGPGLARGYLSRPDLTAEKFIPNPFAVADGERLYRSGDLVRFMDDGNIEFLGRIDQQVKVRGFRIELGEIEAMLTSHEHIVDAAVLAREDTPGSQRLVAYFVAAENHGINSAELRNHLKQVLPEYMVPAVFIPLEEMPLTPSGKIDRSALPVPDQSHRDMENAYTAPRNQTEEKLVAIAAALLHVEKVGVFDNFFELGGHSLLATKFMSRIRDQFNRELPLRILFEKPTIAELAEDLDNKSSPEEAMDTIEHVDRGTENFEDLLASLENLSDEEAEALLNRQLDSERDKE